MMNETLAFFATAIFGFYWLRMCSLSLQLHDATFVLQNVMSGAVAGYSAYVLWEFGVLPLPVMASAASALYLVRSRETFQKITKPAEFDSQPIDPSHWPQIRGAGNRWWR